jgi:purine-binding chemotaxis protein CheW
MGQVAQSTATAPAAAKAGKPAAVAGSDTQQFLTFVLGGEMYALAILNVKEIIEYGNITEIPMMPTFIRGVINLRGAVVPVVDLAARFGGKASEVQRRTCIVIVEMLQDEAKLDIGIMVDAVSEVLEIARSEIEPPPSFGAKIRADFIDGMGKVAGKFVIILNTQRVLSVEEMAHLASLSNHAPEEAAQEAKAN